MADNYNNKKRSKYKEPQGPGIEQQVVEGIFKGIWWLVSLPFKKRTPKRGKSLFSAQQAQQFSVYWNDVHRKMADPATRDLAVAEADKLFDLALKELCVTGQTMGERLKASEAMFTAQQYNQLWEAHKLRNRLAHEVGIAASEAEIKTAIAAFQWGLRTLGAFV